MFIKESVRLSAEALKVSDAAICWQVIPIRYHSHMTSAKCVGFSVLEIALVQHVLAARDIPEI